MRPAVRDTVLTLAARKASGRRYEMWWQVRNMSGGWGRLVDLLALHIFDDDVSIPIEIASFKFRSDGGIPEAALAVLEERGKLWASKPMLKLLGEAKLLSGLGPHFKGAGR